MARDVFAALEAGGTKMICAVADAGGAVLAQLRFATTDPDEVFATLARFHAEQSARRGPVRGAGIASFGPLDLDPASPGYGRLTMTPKANWASVDMLGRFAAIVDAPVAIDTDVNCAALAELRGGAGRGLERIAYVTVGTGIGVGLIDATGPRAIAAHPEAGHIRVARAAGDGFAGSCPSHGDCLEGLACGPAIAARWGCAAEALPADHVGWEQQAHYIAALCVDLTYIARPQRIVIGGGVMANAALYPAVRRRFERLTAGYALDRHSADADRYLCPPDLVDPSPGLVGAIALARDAAGG